jgi:peptidoglycan/xylan/chitin deacetylase (PgdA/CDA1 family)
MNNYPRDLTGYGRNPPHPQWPGQARVALQFVLNYEEGGENCVLHGDPASETFLSEIIGAAAFPNRHMSMESIYEYGSRAGLWRLLRMFEERKLPLTIFGVSMALQRHPEAVAAFQELGHEIACHGLRWIHYQGVDEATEREHMRRAVETIGPALDHLPEHGRGNRARPYEGSGADHQGADRQRAAGLVHRARFAQYAPAGGGAWRLPLRRRLLW